MKNIYYLLHYLTRFLILFIFSIIMSVTISEPIIIQALVITLIVVYFSTKEIQLENLLFDLEKEYIFNEKIFKVINVVAKVIVTFGYLYLLLIGFYKLVIFIFAINLILKIMFDITIEEMFINEKTIIKENDAS